MSGFYLFLSSKDSTKYHPNNKWNRFVCELGRTYDLQASNSRGLGRLNTGNWCLALVDISIESPSKEYEMPDNVIVCCNLATCSYILGTEREILRIVRSGDTVHSASLHQTYYIGLNRLSFNSVTIQLLGKDLKPLPLDLYNWSSDPEVCVTCSLHFQQM